MYLLVNNRVHIAYKLYFTTRIKRPEKPCVAGSIPARATEYCPGKQPGLFFSIRLIGVTGLPDQILDAGYPIIGKTNHNPN